LDRSAAPIPQIAELLNAAFEAQRRGDVAGALRRFEQALEHDPRNPAALNALGLQALGRSDPAAAAELFQRAAAADPSAPPLWINLATAQRGAGDAEGERASLHRVLGLDQRHLMANIRLAELHERLGEVGRRRSAGRCALVPARGRSFNASASKRRRTLSRPRPGCYEASSK